MRDHKPSRAGSDDDPAALVIDCDECAMANTSACDDCIVPVILGAPERRGRIEISNVEMEAMDNLAAEGLVPPLRLVVGE